MEGGREGGREGEREGGREGGREGWKEGRMEGGREGRIVGGRKGGRESSYQYNFFPVCSHPSRWFAVPSKRSYPPLTETSPSPSPRYWTASSSPSSLKRYPASCVFLSTSIVSLVSNFSSLFIRTYIKFRH